MNDTLQKQTSRLKNSIPKPIPAPVKLGACKLFSTMLVRFTQYFNHRITRKETGMRLFQLQNFRSSNISLTFNLLWIMISNFYWDCFNFASQNVLDRVLACGIVGKGCREQKVISESRWCKAQTKGSWGQVWVSVINVHCAMKYTLPLGCTSHSYLITRKLMDCLIGHQKESIHQCKYDTGHWIIPPHHLELLYLFSRVNNLTST